MVSKLKQEITHRASHVFTHRQDSQETHAHSQQCRSHISTALPLTRPLSIWLNSDCWPTDKVLSEKNLCIVIHHIHSTYLYVSRSHHWERGERKSSKGSIEAQAKGSSISPLFFLSAAFSFLLLEGCQSANVVPEGGGFALGLSQHEDLLLGQSSREGRVFLSQQEVIVWSGQHWTERHNKIIMR